MAMYIAKEHYGLSPKEIEEFKQSFHMFDQNGDGKITLTELGNVMRTLGQNPSEADLKLMIRELDTNNSGSVEFHEFLQMYAMKKKKAAAAPKDEEDEVRAAFKTFDRDGDGYISAVELRQVMVSLGEKLSEYEVKEMISAADSDGNGRIDYSEFVKMILKK